MLRLHPLRSVFGTYQFCKSLALLKYIFVYIKSPKPICEIIAYDLNLKNSLEFFYFFQFLSSVFRGRKSIITYVCRFLRNLKKSWKMKFTDFRTYLKHYNLCAPKYFSTLDLTTRHYLFKFN